MVVKWIEASSLAEAIRQSTWLYPFIEIIHILGIVLVAGGAILFDIRLLSNRKAIIENRYLLSWSKLGLILVIPSGLLLFSTNAMALSRDPVFGLKLGLLLLAAINAWVFHVRVFLPANYTTARFHAIASVILWISIISCGRLLAY
ncbi:hypothetical protein [Paraflavitalea sp. CAU 1676]|uniref:hypothetical protein n=1 Tax=Paraflavitalea sp. CAU 1676 TaxID=3032598 RepID=UPI0023DB4661|nr:hypothetical protein [Paraflavitalea sp. CAU 1676]MDF2191254.1 hypothetical protein [Paraflavitalea sp. CAU 1676]